MKVKFKTRMEGIDWIAENAKDEGQFEVWREQLNFNHIYTGKFFIKVSKRSGSVIWLDKLFGKNA